jgi:hypothetical protein
MPYTRQVTGVDIFYHTLSQKQGHFGYPAGVASAPRRK